MTVLLTASGQCLNTHPRVEAVLVQMKGSSGTKQVKFREVCQSVIGCAVTGMEYEACLTYLHVCFLHCEDGTHHGLTYLTRLLGFVISTQWNVLISSNRLIVS